MNPAPAEIRRARMEADLTQEAAAAREEGRKEGLREAAGIARECDAQGIMAERAILAELGRGK
mgnify:CR=1 FL=1